MEIQLESKEQLDHSTTALITRFVQEAMNRELKRRRKDLDSIYCNLVENEDRTKARYALAETREKLEGMNTTEVITTAIANYTRLLKKSKGVPPGSQLRYCIIL